MDLLRFTISGVHNPDYYYYFFLSLVYLKNPGERDASMQRAEYCLKV